MIRVTIAGLSELRDKVNLIVKNAGDLKPGLEQAGAYMMGVARARIRRGGDPAWPENISGTKLLEGNKVLFNSLQIGGPQNIYELSESQVRVGTAVFYAKWLQEGTGIYGERGTPIVPLRTVTTNMYGESYKLKIRPNVSSDKTYHTKLGDFKRDAAALAFRIGGKMHFFKSVKGSPKRPYLYIDEKDAKNIAKIFGNYIMGKPPPEMP